MIPNVRRALLAVAAILSLASHANAITVNAGQSVDFVADVSSLVTPGGIYNTLHSTRGYFDPNTLDLGEQFELRVGTAFRLSDLASYSHTSTSDGGLGVSYSHYLDISGLTSVHWRFIQVVGSVDLDLAFVLIVDGSRPPTTRLFRPMRSPLLLSLCLPHCRYSVRLSRYLVS